MYRSLIPIFLIAALLGAAPAQAKKKPAQVQGTVIDEAGEPLEGVLVVATSPDDAKVRLQDKTNREGKFSINIKDSSLAYLWSFQKVGHEPLITTLEITEGKVANVDVTLPSDTSEIALRRKATEFYNQGVEAFNDGQQEKALELFQQATQAASNMPEGFLGLAQVALSLERYDVAIEAAQGLKALNRESLDAHRILFQSALKLSDEESLEEGLAALEGTDLAVNAAVSLYNDGVGLLEAEELDLARKRFLQAGRLNPVLAAPYQALASMAFNAQDFEGTLATTEELLAREPENPHGLRLRYLAAEYLNRSEVAAAALEGLQKADPETAARLRSQQAETLFKAGRLEEAKKLLHEVLAAQPEDAEAHYTLALCLLNSGDTPGARRHLQRVVELSPDSQKGRDAKDMLQFVK